MFKESLKLLESYRSEMDPVSMLGRVSNLIGRYPVRGKIILAAINDELSHELIALLSEMDNYKVIGTLVSLQDKVKAWVYIYYQDPVTFTVPYTYPRCVWQIHHSFDAQHLQINIRDDDDDEILEDYYVDSTTHGDGSVVTSITFDAPTAGTVVVRSS